jgi:hypothetical protein
VDLLSVQAEAPSVLGDHRHHQVPFRRALAGDPGIQIKSSDHRQDGFDLTLG